MAENGAGPIMDPRLAEWFGSGDTGISSETIALWLSARAKLKRWGFGEPSDGADFGRCYRLLEFIPEWRGRIGEMAARGGRWPDLVARWNEIETTYLSEVANEPGSAGATYRLMKQVLAEPAPFAMEGA
jgi:hypothetical protein